MEKFCTKCGHKFKTVGREVICPSCKAHAAEEVKKAAVLRAKKASWTGESVPVRISGRASTVIRAYSAANGMPFAQALDDLLKASDYFRGTGKAWEDVEPYKSRRRKSATEDVQEVKQDVSQDVTSKPQTAQAAKVAKTTSKTTSTAASKTTRKAASKATKTSGAAKK